MKIYTKTGDAGTTSLLGGARVSKADIRINAYGTVDELNAFVGLVRDFNEQEDRRTLLKHIQDRLFTIGGQLATQPDKDNVKVPDLHEEDITMLEEAIDAMEATLPPLKNFVLPGGHPAVSYCHLARTVCRRAERRAIALRELSPVAEIIPAYLNRLSDYFFVLSRTMAHELGVGEVTWQPRG